MKIILASIAALGLAGCGPMQTTLDPSVTAAIKTGTATAVQKAGAALGQICDKYQFADAAFQIATITGYIPARYVEAEATAVQLIARVCAAPPTDPVTSYKAAQDALTTVLSIRQQFRAVTKKAVVAGPQGNG